MIAEKLKNLVKVKGGKRLPKGSSYSDVETGHPYLRVCDFKRNSIKAEGLKYISHDIHSKVSRYIIGHEDVFISIAGTIGLAGIIPEYLSGANLTENAAKLVIEDKTKLDKKYLSWFLNTNGQNQIKQATKATSQPKLALFRIEEIKIPLPPLEEQRRIAAILDKADAIRRKQQQAIELCDQFLKALFIDMFGDPVTNPKGWEKINLFDLASRMCDGPFGSNLKTEHYTDSGIRVIRLKNIGVGKFIQSDEAFISRSHYKSLPRNHCKSGDVVIGTLGEPNLRACIIPENIEEALNKADCILFRGNAERVNHEFIAALINQPAVLHLASFMFHGQTRVRVSMGQLKTLKIPIPPLDLQNKFAEIVKKTEVKKAKLQKNLGRLNDSFNALSQKAFKGEL